MDPDLYTWTVALDDGTELTEASLGGMAAVPIDRVRRLDVWCPSVDPDRPAFTVPLSPDQTLIWFRDRRVVVRAEAIEAAQDGDAIEGERTTWATVFGWKTTVNGRVAKTYVWLMGDGGILVTDHDVRFEAA